MATNTLKARASNGASSPCRREQGGGGRVVQISGPSDIAKLPHGQPFIIQVEAPTRVRLAMPSDPWLTIHMPST